MDIKDQIRICREAAGLTRVEFAAKLNPPVSEQAVIWWETGEHRPRMNRIQDINRVLGVRLDVSEQGEATAPSSSGVTSIGVDPEYLRLAVAIGRLPKEQREAIITLVRIGETTALGKTAKPFTVTETTAKKSKPFLTTEKGITNDEPSKASPKKYSRRSGNGA